MPEMLFIVAVYYRDLDLTFMITRAAITMHYLIKCLLPLPPRGLYGSHITNVHVTGYLCGSIGTDRGSIIGRSSPYYVQYTVSVYCMYYINLITCINYL